MDSRNNESVEIRKNVRTLTVAERAYWQQRMPNGFQFYLERLARAVIRNHPSDIPLFAATFLEELLVNRDAELWCLPQSSYFSQLTSKRLGHAPWIPRRIHRRRFTRHTTPPPAQAVFPDLVPIERLPEIRGRNDLQMVTQQSNKDIANKMPVPFVIGTLGDTINRHCSTGCRDMLCHPQQVNEDDADDFLGPTHTHADGTVCASSSIDISTQGFESITFDNTSYYTSASVSSEDSQMESECVNDRSRHLAKNNVPSHVSKENTADFPQDTMKQSGDQYDNKNPIVPIVHSAHCSEKSESLGIGENNILSNRSFHSEIAHELSECDDTKTSSKSSSSYETCQNGFSLRKLLTSHGASYEK